MMCMKILEWVGIIVKKVICEVVEGMKLGALGWFENVMTMDL